MCIPYSDMRRERVEVECLVFNYWNEYFIIEFLVLKLSDASNPTARHPSLV